MPLKKETETDTIIPVDTNRFYNFHFIRFCSASLLKGISTLVGYLQQKLSLFDINFFFSLRISLRFFYLDLIYLRLFALPSGKL